MKKNAMLLCAALVSLAIVSCNKEIETSTGATADITGTWKLMSMQAQTNATNQVTAGADVVRTVTASNYTTTDNSGTITISSGTMTSNNISYAVNTVAKASVYENGTLTDTFSIPMQVTIPASSGTYNYTRVSADSIYFPSGSFTMGETTQASQPGGVKVKLEQDKLYMIQSASQNTTTTVQGQTVSSSASVSSTATFQRQ